MLIEAMRRPSRLATSEGAARGTFVALQAVALVLLVVLGTRRAWFFGDEWAFITQRRDLWADGELVEFLLQPHNEHWVTLPVLWYSAVFKVVEVHHYWPYLAGVVLVHLVAATFLRQLLRRCGAGPWLATGMASVFLFLGSGTENLVWAFQIGFAGAAALGLACLWFASGGPDRPSRVDVAGTAAAVAALLCSGPALSYIAAATATLALRRRWARAAIVGGVPAVVFAAWWLAYGRGTPSVPREDLAAFTWRGVGHVVESVAGLAGAGAVLVLVAFVALLRAAGRQAPGWEPPAAAGAAVVLFYGLTATGRAGLGLDAALASRYVHTVGPLALLALLPAVLWLGDLLRPASARAVALGGLVAWALVVNVSGLWQFLRAYEPAVDGSRARIEAAAALDLAAAPPEAKPDPDFAPNLTAASLAELLASGAFPRPAAVPAADRADAAARLLVEVAGAPPDSPVVAPVTCEPLGPAGTPVRGPSGSGFEVVGTGGPAQLVVVDAGVASPPRELPTEGPGPVVVRLAAPLELVVSAPAPGLELCPATP